MRFVLKLSRSGNYLLKHLDHSMKAISLLLLLSERRAHLYDVCILVLVKDSLPTVVNMVNTQIQEKRNVINGLL
jgi:hypothetical protein